MAAKYGITGLPTTLLIDRRGHVDEVHVGKVEKELFEVTQRAFAATAVLTLALGIGATTAIFSVVYGVLLRPSPSPSQRAS